MFDNIQEIFRNIVFHIADIYNGSQAVRGFILSILGIFTFHKTFYLVAGCFLTRKFKPAEKNHKYAILIPARNEEAVIGNLIKSIKKQKYPQELLTIFVVADNCTDETAEVARQHGAICYERFNDQDRTKGFALQFLFENIKKDYGIEAFEGYFIFDSDNLLKKDYIARMNDAFDSGEKIITSYRNTKNFDENWVASTYALHWLRSIRQNHRIRSFLHLATNIQGTGFLFANELVRDGWNYTSLTEDRAFTADAVAHGYQISYNDAAVFYDEQPISMKIALRQRMRWAKGHLLAFLESGWPLFKNIFVGNCFRDKSEKRVISKESFVEGIRHRWASFDTLAQLIPSALIKVVLWLLVSVFFGACYYYANGVENQVIFSGGNWLMKLLNAISGEPCLTMEPGKQAMLYGVGMVIMWNFIGKMAYHGTSIIMAAYIFIAERKRIKQISLWKKIFYCVTWPSFDMIGRWALYAAVFMNVTWKPIPHTSKVTIEDIDGENDGDTDNES